MPRIIAQNGYVRVVRVADFSDRAYDYIVAEVCGTDKMGVPHWTPTEIGSEGHHRGILCLLSSLVPVTEDELPKAREPACECETACGRKESPT